MINIGILEGKCKGRQYKKKTLDMTDIFKPMKSKTNSLQSRYIWETLKNTPSRVDGKIFLIGF